MDPSVRGRPVVRWKDRMKEYMYERGADGWGGSVWIGRDGGSSAMAIPLGEVYRGNEESEFARYR